MAGEQADTIIGSGVELKGSLRNSGPIQIHGRIIGDVQCESTVFVGETAVVTGPIVAKQVDVAGQVHGSITAESQIELHPKSLVKGDLSTTRLSIKPGATFIGKSQMPASGQEDLSEHDLDRKKPRAEVE